MCTRHNATASSASTALPAASSRLFQQDAVAGISYHRKSAYEEFVNFMLEKARTDETNSECPATNCSSVNCDGHKDEVNTEESNTSEVRSVEEAAGSPQKEPTSEHSSKQSGESSSGRQPLTEKPVTDNIQKDGTTDTKVTFQQNKVDTPEYLGWDPSHSLWQNKNAVRELDQQQMEALLASLQQSRCPESVLY